MDPNCTSIPAAQRGGPAGKLYSQPRDACECGARVLELFTCRNCGTARARAYTNDVNDPDFLWAEPGSTWDVRRVCRRDRSARLLLKKPVFNDLAEPAEYDLITGRLNPQKLEHGIEQSTSGRGGPSP
ncbi:hypothetical protein RLIN73S_02496 [Rhodanobacter lindaniclasticus]